MTFSLVALDNKHWWKLVSLHLTAKTEYIWCRCAWQQRLSTFGVAAHDNKDWVHLVSLRMTTKTEYIWCRCTWQQRDEMQFGLCYYMFLTFHSFCLKLLISQTKPSDPLEFQITSMLYTDTLTSYHTCPKLWRSPLTVDVSNICWLSNKQCRSWSDAMI